MLDRTCKIDTDALESGAENTHLILVHIIVGVQGIDRILLIFTFTLCNLAIQIFTSLGSPSLLGDFL